VTSFSFPCRVSHTVISIIGRRLAGVSPWARAVGGILAALMLANCGSENPTGPTRLSHRPDATASHTITSLGTYSIPIPPTNTDSYALCCNYTTTSGAQSLTGTGIVIPAGTLYRVRVHGTVTVSPNPLHQAAYPNNPDTSAVGTYGPGGTGRIGAELLVIMQLHNMDGSGVTTVSLTNVQTGIGARDTASTLILSTAKAAELWVGRVGVAGSTNDNCCHWNIGDYALTASQTVTVEQLTNFVHLTAAPAYVHPGQQVTFKVDNDDGTPQTVTRWTWTRDPGTNANPPNGCGWAINPCTAAVFGSGTMTASTDYGAPYAHVTVYTNFTLDADNTTPFAGDTVTFTPKLDGVTAVAARWRWVPDTAGTADVVSCLGGTAICKKLITHSGTMWAYLLQVGGDSASKHVTAAPRCPIADPILNTYEIRQALKNLLSESGPDLAPGDGIAPGDSVGNKREHGGYVFKTSDGAYYFVDDTVAQLTHGWATECTFHESGSLQYQRNPNDVVVAHAHAHPTRFKKIVYGCPSNATGPDQESPTKRGPWDISRPNARKDPDIHSGGGSLWGDWLTVVNSWRDEYVINANDEVWHLPKELEFTEQSSNRAFWKYRGNSDSSCNW
jgi:hypothetical protein